MNHTLHTILRGLGWMLFRAVFVMLPVAGASVIAGWPLSAQYGPGVWRSIAWACGGIAVVAVLLSAPGCFWIGDSPRPGPTGRLDAFVSRVVTGSVVGLTIGAALGGVVLVLGAIMSLMWGWAALKGAAVVAGILAEGAVLRCIARTLRRDRRDQGEAPSAHAVRASG